MYYPEKLSSIFDGYTDSILRLIGSSLANLCSTLDGV